jgi:glucose-6-phosphate-specific signal transduction histidine kinase
MQSVTGMRRVFDVGLGIGRAREQRLLRSLGADLERETQLRRALAEVVRAQDAEARRVAELLHDDAVQALTALAAPRAHRDAAGGRDAGRARA